MVYTLRLDHLPSMASISQQWKSLETLSSLEFQQKGLSYRDHHCSTEAPMPGKILQTINY